MVAPSSGGAAVIIALERWRPYDRGQPFLRDGFWVDLVTYALFQSYFLALVINLLIGCIDGWTGASRHGLVSEWPIAAQLALFVISHDLYIYWFHRLQHGKRWLWRLHEAHQSARHVGDRPPSGREQLRDEACDLGLDLRHRVPAGEQAGRLRTRRGVSARLPGAARVRVPAVRAVRALMLLRLKREPPSHKRCENRDALG